MESIESIRPPLPGISLPESLMDADLFTTDSVKSPTMDANAVIIARRIILKTDPVKISGRKNRNSIPESSAPRNPPTKPAMLLLGLAFTIPRFVFPIVIPKSHAIESKTVLYFLLNAEIRTFFG